MASFAVSFHFNCEDERSVFLDVKLDVANGNIKERIGYMELVTPLEKGI